MQRSLFYLCQNRAKKLYRYLQQYTSIRIGAFFKMDKLQVLKGKISMLPHFGLTYDVQILVALPQIFNYEDNQRMKKIHNFPKYFQAVCDDLYVILSKVRHRATYNLILKKILPNVWPILIRKADPQKFNDNLRYLKDTLQLGPEHIDFMSHFSKKFPEKYPQFCIKHTNQFFQKHKSNYELLINSVVGEQCIESLMSILRFDVHKELMTQEENQFVQEEFHVSSMNKILEKLLSRKNNISKLIRDARCDAIFVRYIDSWIEYQNNHVLNIFRCLKIISLCQCLFDIKFSEQSSEAAKSQEPIFKIIWKVGERLLHRLFVGKIKQKILILDWILQGKTWTQCNQQLKSSLMYFLIACYQVHSKAQDSCKQPLSQKIYEQQNILMRKYLMKIKEKHFHNVSFTSKVPKSYLKINLGMLQTPGNYKEQIQSNNSLLKNTSGTLFIQKLGTESLSVNGSKGISSADKLITSVIKYTENLELHKIFVICLALKQDVRSKNIDPEETDTEQKPFPKKSTSFRRLFYYIFKCINQYEKILLPNILSRQITKMLSKFGICFGFDTMKEIYNADLYDLQLLSNGQFSVENVSANLLKNSIYYSLASIYVIESAHNCYMRALSENKKSAANKAEKIQDIEKVNLLSSNIIFFQCLEKFIKFLTKKKQEVVYLRQICSVDNWRILKSLFLNFLYYILSKLNLKGKEQLAGILGNLFKEYFQKNEPNKQELNVINILATTHKIMENWRKCTRRNQGSDSKIMDSLYENHEQQVIKAQIYWSFMVNTAKNSKKVQAFSRNFERVNCIKESIYMMHEHNFKTFPPKFTVQEARRVYSLYSRLESHLSMCRPYIEKNMESKCSNYHDRTENSKYLSMLQDEESKRKWYNSLKFISENSNIQILTLEITQIASKISLLQDIEEIDQILNQAYILSLFYEAVNDDNYSGLQLNLTKSNQKQMCLGIAACLQRKRNYFCNSKKKDSKKIKQISEIIYNQRIRFKQYELLRMQLNQIHPENMTPEQARAAIILYSQTQEYHKVRLLFKAMQSNGHDYKIYKQELQFRNIEAGYKCMMYYPIDHIVRDLESIVKYIQEENDLEKITKNSTSSMFQSFKFICQNYPSLTLDQESKILRLLNRYLKKVDMVSNNSLSIEAVYFILRFILIESNNSDQLIEDSNSFPYQAYKANILEPHRPMLIGIISEDEKKNQLICKILTRIAQHDPKASSWWLYGLKNHCKINDKIDRLDSVIENCGKSIYDEIKRKMINLDSEFAWIDWLFSADEKAQMKPIPKQMVSPFSTDVILEKVLKISPLGQGKSKPVIIEFKANKKKNPITVYLIRKTMARNSIGFRAESSTANFFKDSKLLKEGVTYSIIHLSKYCLLVEYIKHFSTLDSLMLYKIPSTETMKLQKIIQLSGMNKVLGPVYDNDSLQVNFQLRLFFASQSTLVNSWWNKYTNFLKTYAQWCFLGYIVGLGDRHSNNILVTEDGETIHIDFQFIFDTGMNLPLPEWVPFRLSRGLLHQLSIIEPYGLLYSEFIKTAEKYRSKSREVWLAESHFSFFKKGNVSIHKRAELNNRPYEQSVKIFQNATSDLMLRDMFKGWGSYK